MAPAPAVAAAADSVARITLRSAPLGRTVSVVVSPPDAHVQIDGMDAPVQRGVVSFTGGLGSVHRLRLSAERRETAVDVTIAEEGPVPPEVRVGRSPVGERR
jgi:hypothetical protein